MFRKKWGSRRLLIWVGVCGLSLLFILMIREHLTHVQREKRDLILMTLGSRNTSELVKPDEQTIIIDGTLPFFFQVVDESHDSMPNSSSSTLNKQAFDLQDSKSMAPFAIIVVLSQIGYEENRFIVRQTWYQWAKALNCQIVFFLGIPSTLNFSMSELELEIQEHNDIIVDEFVENYYLLPVKVLRVLKWFQNTYPNEESQPNFMVKADHDVFIHLPNLIRHLKTVVHVSNYLGGLVHSDAPVIRDGYSKWFTPYELWNVPTFPPYLSGPCYYIHGSFVKTLFESSLSLPLFHLEDVFLTGFVAGLLLNTQLDSLPQDHVIHSELTLMQRRYAKNIHHAISYHPMDAKTMLKYYQLAIKNQK